MKDGKHKKDMNQKEEIKNENEVQDEQSLENGSQPELDEKHIKEMEEKDQKITELETEISELKDKLLRRAAEFENYKRRTENDQLNLIKYAAEPIIQTLLPIVDDFERSLLHIENAKDINAIKEGLKLVYDKLIKALKEQGVEKIDSIGEAFDVEFHEALMQKPVEGVEPHTVVEEIEKGYKYKDKIIRHAKVIVSEIPAEEQSNNSTEK